MNTFKKLFDLVSAEHYIPVYAVTATNKITILITERDIQDFTIEQSQIKNNNHFSFFTIRKIERDENLILIEIDLNKSKQNYFSESNIESEKFLYKFETNDANNFILYLNRALYRILTPEEIKSINVDGCSKFVTLFPPSSSSLNADLLLNDNHTNNSQITNSIQPFYVYSRFIEKVLLSNSNNKAQPIEKLVSEVSLKNLRKILKYKISKINIFRDFPDCSKYFEILLIDIIPFSKYITNLVFDSSINSTVSNNIENFVKCLIKCIENSKCLKEVTFVGELPSGIEDFFTKLCEKKEMSILSLTFKNVKLSQQQLSIFNSSPIKSYRFSGQNFDSNDTLLNFIETNNIDLLSIKNSPQTDFLSNLNKFANITVLSLCKNNIEIGDFFSALSKIESRIQCLYLSGNKCEKEISNDIKIPKFEEIRLDNISWGDFFFSYFQNLLKTQIFVDLSNSTMNDNEWNKVFNYLNTTSDGVSQLCKLLWNGNKVNKSFFSYLRKCVDSLDSLQIVDVIDQSTEKEIFDEFISFLKEGNKLTNLFIGFSKQESKSITGNQMKSILSALLINMKKENSKQFYLSVPNSSSGDEGVDALIDSFNNIEDCKIDFITFDGLQPQNPKKYIELCHSITNYVIKLNKNKNSSYEIQFPKNDLKFLKNQMEEKDYKKLRHDFRFIITSQDFDYLPSDFLFNRMTLSPILTKKRFYVKTEEDDLFFESESNSNVFYDCLSDKDMQKERTRKKKKEIILSEDDEYDKLFDEFLDYSDTKSNRKDDTNKNKTHNYNDDDDDEEEFTLSSSDDEIEKEKIKSKSGITKNKDNYDDEFIEDIVEDDKNRKSKDKKNNNSKNPKRRNKTEIQKDDESNSDSDKIKSKNSNIENDNISEKSIDENDISSETESQEDDENNKIKIKSSNIEDDSTSEKSNNENDDNENDINNKIENQKEVERIKNSNIEDDNKNDESKEKSNDENDINSKIDVQKGEISNNQNDKDDVDNEYDEETQHSSIKNLATKRNQDQKEENINSKSSTINQDDQNENQIQANNKDKSETEKNLNNNDENDEEAIHPISESHPSLNSNSIESENNHKGDELNEIECKERNKNHKPNPLQITNNISGKDDEATKDKEYDKSSQSSSIKNSTTNQNRDQEEEEEEERIDNNNSGNRNPNIIDKSISHKESCKDNKETEKDANKIDEDTRNNNYNENESIHSISKLQQHEHSKISNDNTSQSQQFELEEKEEDKEQNNQQGSNQKKHSKSDVKPNNGNNQEEGELNAIENGNTDHKPNPIQKKNEIKNKNDDDKAFHHSSIRNQDQEEEKESNNMRDENSNNKDEDKNEIQIKEKFIATKESDKISNDGRKETDEIANNNDENETDNNDNEKELIQSNTESHKPEHSNTTKKSPNKSTSQSISHKESFNDNQEPGRNANNNDKSIGDNNGSNKESIHSNSKSQQNEHSKTTKKSTIENTSQSQRFEFEYEEEEEEEEQSSQQVSNQKKQSKINVKNQSNSKLNEIKIENGNKGHTSNQIQTRNSSIKNLTTKRNQDQKEEIVNSKSRNINQNKKEDQSKTNNNKIVNNNDEKSINEKGNNKETIHSISDFATHKIQNHEEKVNSNSKTRNKNSIIKEKSTAIKDSSSNNKETRKNTNNKDENTRNRNDNDKLSTHSISRSQQHQNLKTTKKSTNENTSRSPQFEIEYEEEEEEEEQSDKRSSYQKSHLKNEVKHQLSNSLALDSQNNPNSSKLNDIKYGNGSKSRKSNPIQTRNNINNRKGKNYEDEEYDKSSQRSPRSPKEEAINNNNKSIKNSNIKDKSKRSSNDKDKESVHSISKSQQQEHSKTTKKVTSRNPQFEYEEEEEEESEHLVIGQKRHSPNMVKVSLTISNVKNRKSNQKGESQFPHLDFEYESENENQKPNQTKANNNNNNDNDEYDYEYEYEYEQTAKCPSVKSYTPNRNPSKAYKTSHTPQPKKNRSDILHHTKRSTRRKKRGKASSLISAPLSATNKSKRRRFRKKSRDGDEHYESDSGYDEHESVILKNQLTNTDPSLTSNRNNRKSYSQTLEKVDFLKGANPNTIKDKKNVHKNKHQHHCDDVLVNVQNMNSSRRKSLPYKGKSSLLDGSVDRGSDIEFPEMDEITHGNQKRDWTAIEERFSLKNILHNIRANK